MAGNFNGKEILPGTYINYKAKKNTSPTSSIRGVAVVPLLGYDWGPDSTMIKVESTSPDANFAKFGRSVFDTSNALIRYVGLALENSATVYAYIAGGSAKATKVQGDLTVTAKYKGTLGNNITVSIAANPTGGFDVAVYVKGQQVELFEKYTTIDALKDVASEWVDFSGTGNLVAVASIELAGGTDTASTTEAITAYLDACEKIKFNTALVPWEDSSIKATVKSKVTSLRNAAGKTVQFVCVENAADNEGIINVVNSFAYNDDQLNKAQAAAWVTGAEAGSSKTTSNTYKVVPGATSVVGELGLEAAKTAAKDGKMFFSVDDEGNIILTYDINSLVNPNTDQDESYKKNRVLRTLDSFADDLRINLRPNLFNNDNEGWDLMVGIGKTLLTQYLADGAIKNVNPDEDFTVEITRSSGDDVYFNVALQPVDSAEKIYITINTQ